MAKSKNFTSSDPRELVVLDLGTLLQTSPSAKITLDCGQHRRAAVLKINQQPVNATSGVFKKDGHAEDNQSTMWPVEFYSTEFLAQHPLTCNRLRYKYHLSPLPSFAGQNDANEDSGFEYTKRFSMPVWNTVLQMAFDYLSPVFSKQTFMNHFNDPAKIMEAKLPWKIWGATTGVANFIHNSELRRLPMTRNAFVRQELNEEARLFWAMFTYRQLKMVWLAHIRAADAAQTTRDEQAILSDADREVVEAAMVQYAEYLNSVGLWQVDPFDLENLDLLRVSSILRYVEVRGRPESTTDRAQADPFVAVITTKKSTTFLINNW